MNGFDPEIVQDFLTEALELVERLDRDLVALEAAPADGELLNSAFRAAHTVKGSASFLLLTPLVEAAHAAEAALDRARRGEGALTREVMDAVLAAVDTIRRQLGALRDGSELPPLDAATAGVLTGGPGQAPHAQTVESATDENGVVAVPAAVRRPLNLPENKAALVDFLVQDLRDSLSNFERSVMQMADASRREAGCAALSELVESLQRTAVFFELSGMSRLCAAMNAYLGGEVAPETLAQALPRLLAVGALLGEQAESLARGEVVERGIDRMCAELELLGAQGQCEGVLGFGASAADALVMDCVVGSVTDLPAAQAMVAVASERPEIPAPFESVPVDASLDENVTSLLASAPQAVESAPEQAAPPPTQRSTPAGTAPARSGAESTIRVEVGRLEALLNLVGELVLQKNRIGAIAGSAGALHGVDDAWARRMSEAADGLARVTDDLRLAVMRTRMQPLAKLFGKYPRLVRDLARKVNKDINLIVQGDQTEVDRSVLEELSDPLMHLLRNAADHGIETAEERIARGKSPAGTLWLSARHAGGLVEISLSDDGRGFSRARIGHRAVERGLVTPGELDRLSDREVFNFVFAPGFSTAERVTDISGRGVGMDVVRTNISKINGEIVIGSVEGAGSSITIRIPLTVAIMDAMMIRLCDQTYAIPLSGVVEIVRPRPEDVATVHGLPVLRQRGSLLPLLSGAEVFGLNAPEAAAPTVVVLASGEGRVGLRVDRVLGQQEIVVKSLDTGPTGSPADSAISGATVRDDGGVSLILDIPRLLAIGTQRLSVRGASDNRRRFLRAIEEVEACAA